MVIPNDREEKDYATLHIDYWTGFEYDIERNPYLDKDYFHHITGAKNDLYFRAQNI